MKVVEGGWRLTAIAGTLFIIVAAASPSSQSENGALAAMRIRDSYPLVTTPFLFEARDFYVRHFGFKPLFQASWFVYLAGEGEEGGRGPTVAFMHPNHPSGVPGTDSFSGLGMILTIEVADASAAHESLKKSGAPVVYPLTDEAWGQRHFMTRDPSGMIVDVVQQTAPKAGFWEQYPVTR
jgi:uncharacterized glyoxalase superfamily protein PhnB